MPDTQGVEVQVNEREHQSLESLLTATANAFHLGEGGREVFALKDKEQDIILQRIEDIGKALPPILLFNR